jgi:hypothetical protein
MSAELLAIAAEEMERVLEREPLLILRGFNIGRVTPEYAEQDRERMRDPNELAAFSRAREWLAGFAKTEKLNKRCGTSYGLKHVAERKIGYITNGTFICAAIAEGFRVERCASDSPNAYIAIARDAWK